LERLLTRLREKNIILSPDKCKLGLQTAEFVGHTITPDGITFSDKKRKEIFDIELPKTQRQLKHFMGLANYFCKNLKDMNRWAPPLNDLMKPYLPEKVIDWTDALLEHFEFFKAHIYNMPMRWFQDPDLPVYLATDASRYGIGGYLYQVHTDTNGVKTERPIEFVSKGFTDQQKRWNTTDQEAFAIYFCLLKLQDRLADIPFTLMTDHRNLLFINDASSSRVLRWKLAIQEFDFNIIHIPGKDNIAADNLSRVPNIIHETEDDHIDMLMLLDEFVIPPEVKKAFHHVHNASAGHMGLEKTMERMKEMGFAQVPYLRNMVRTMIQTCDVCQKQSRTKPKYSTSLFHTTTDRPMQRINIDTIGPFPEDIYGFKHILVIIDTFTRWVDVKPLQTTAAEEAARHLLHHIVNHGCPNQIMTDNGTQFMNDLFSNLYGRLGVEGVVSIPYSKEENGLVERANKEVQRHLEAMCYETQYSSKWSDYLPLVQRIINASVHSITGQKPADLLYAKAIDLDVGVFLPLDEIPNDDLAVNIPDYIARMTAASQDLIALAQRTQRAIQDDEMAERTSLRKSKKLIQPEIQIGDYVLLERPTSKPKLQLPRTGPYIVTKTARDEVTVETSNGRSRRARITQVIPYKYDPMSSTTPQTSQAKDAKLYTVEKIVSFRKLANKKGKNAYVFVVKWLGYDHSDNTEEPYSGLRNNSVWREWATKHKKHEIRQLAPKE
jgi:transposase InsO family protein